MGHHRDGAHRHQRARPRLEPRPDGRRRSASPNSLHRSSRTCRSDRSTAGTSVRARCPGAEPVRVIPAAHGLVQRHPHGRSGADARRRSPAASSASRPRRWWPDHPAGELGQLGLLRGHRLPGHRRLGRDLVGRQRRGRGRAGCRLERERGAAAAGGAFGRRRRPAPPVHRRRGHRDRADRAAARGPAARLPAARPGARGVGRSKSIGRKGPAEAPRWDHRRADALPPEAQPRREPGAGARGAHRRPAGCSTSGGSWRPRSPTSPRRAATPRRRSGLDFDGKEDLFFAIVERDVELILAS